LRRLESLGYSRGYHQLVKNTSPNEKSFVGSPVERGLANGYHRHNNSAVINTAEGLDAIGQSQTFDNRKAPPAITNQRLGAYNNSALITPNQMGSPYDDGMSGRSHKFNNSAIKRAAQNSLERSGTSPIDQEKYHKYY
jgi:hypothetical protein